MKPTFTASALRTVSLVETKILRNCCKTDYGRGWDKVRWEWRRETGDKLD